MSFGKTLIQPAEKPQPHARGASGEAVRYASGGFRGGNADEVVPGIDMLKLIAVTLDEPIVHLLDMPEHLCESCGMILTPDDYGTNAAGREDEHFCKWCYEQGAYTYETTMEAMIRRLRAALGRKHGHDA